MQPDRRPRSVLVPIVGSDISEETLARARSVLKHPGARLVLVHVVSPRRLAHCAEGRQAGACDAEIPRWQRLAAAVPPERLFVDAALGEPAEVILSHARRVGGDLLVLDPPELSTVTTTATRTTPRPQGPRHPNRRHHADRPRTPRRAAFHRRERLEIG